MNTTSRLGGRTRRYPYAKREKTSRLSTAFVTAKSNRPVFHRLLHVTSVSQSVVDRPIARRWPWA
jgi:hypothetical protein